MRAGERGTIRYTPWSEDVVQGFVRVVFGEILSRVLLGEGPFKTFESVRVEQIINVMWLARWVVGHSLGRRAWGSVWGGGNLHGRIGLVGCRTRAKLVRMGGLPNLEPQRCLLYNLAEGPSNRDTYPVKVRRIRTQCCVPTGVTVTPIDLLPPPLRSRKQHKINSRSASSPLLIFSHPCSPHPSVGDVAYNTDEVRSITDCPNDHLFMTLHRISS